MSERYMTVGEVADLVGVTIRSIQYYDQQGVLSPSAKGPQNQRLYTADDVRRLYRVLCLKYAGLSLSQIREAMQAPAASVGADARAVFADAMRETEGAFSTLLRRYATLRALEQTVADAAAAGAEPDWEAMERGIEDRREAGKFFWRLSCIYDDNGDGEPDEGASSEERQRLLASWHALMAEAVGLMRSHEPLGSPRSRAVARQVLALREQDALSAEGERVLVLENAPRMHGDAGSTFGDLRQEMSAYLDRLVAAYRASGASAGEDEGECVSGETRDDGDGADAVSGATTFPGAASAEEGEGR